jgi:hypothetical protein
MWAAPVAAVILCVVGAAAAFASGSLSMPSFLQVEGVPETRYVSVGDQQTYQGLTLTLKEVAYTSSETALYFTAEYPEGQLTDVLIPGNEITFEGLRLQPEPELKTYPGKSSLDISLVAGPALGEGTPVLVRIPRIHIILAGGTGNDIQGPFGFELRPTASDLDTIDVSIPVNATSEVAGTQITVDSAHVSSTGLQVQYTIDHYAYIAAMGSTSRLLLPDGNWIRSRQDLKVGEDDAHRVATFDLPRGMDYATLAFGPFLNKVNEPVDLSVPLPSTRDKDKFDVLDTNLGGERVTVGFQQYSDRFALFFSNKSDTRSIMPDQDAPINVSDDLGNKYSISDLGGSLGTDATGAPYPDQIVAYFIGVIPREASSLKLHVPDLARFVEGPSFSLDLRSAHAALVPTDSPTPTPEETASSIESPTLKQ